MLPDCWLIDWLIDWLMFNVSISNIWAISWRVQTVENVSTEIEDDVRFHSIVALLRVDFRTRNIGFFLFADNISKRKIADKRSKSTEWICQTGKCQIRHLPATYQKCRANDRQITRYSKPPVWLWLVYVFIWKHILILIFKLHLMLHSFFSH